MTNTDREAEAQRLAVNILAFLNTNSAPSKVSIAALLKVIVSLLIANDISEETAVKMFTRASKTLYEAAREG